MNNPATTNTSTYTYMVVTGRGTNGWFRNSFGAFQKVNGAVYAYVTPNMFGMYTAQLYLRGTAALCTLEARTASHGNPVPLFVLAENWLIDYGDGDRTKLAGDFYNIDNPDGAWFSQTKAYYISG